MSPRAIFIAATPQQAAFWAELWGYDWREVAFVPVGNWEQKLQGRRPADLPVFACGTRKDAVRHRELGIYLWARGFEVLDAESVEHADNPELARELMPFECFAEFEDYCRRMRPDEPATVAEWNLMAAKARQQVELRLLLAVARRERLERRRRQAEARDRSLKARGVLLWLGRRR